MALATVSDLRTSVSDWLARSDLSDALINDLILLAEARMNRDLRINLLERRASLNTTAGDGYISLPTDSGGTVDATEVRKLSYVSSPSYEPLQFATPGTISFRRYEGLTGKPVVYSIVGTEFQLAPIPDAIYELRCTYLAKLAALSDSNTTNDILTNHPDLSLFGVLAEAEPYTGFDERRQLWESKYQACLAAARSADNRLKYNGAPLVERAG